MGAEAILETKVSLGDVFAHLSTLAIMFGYFLKYYKVQHRLIERSDQMYSAFCKEHKIEFTGIEEK